MCTAVETIRGLVAGELADLPEDALVKIFQHMRGIKADGNLGPQTVEEAERPRFCAVKDNLSGTRAMWDHSAWDPSNKKWKDSPRNMLLRWHVTEALAPLSFERTKAAIGRSLGFWTEVCAIVFEFTTDASKANLLFSVQRLDQRGGVLAQFQLPYGKDTPATTLRGEFDTSEVWTDAESPKQGEIGLLHVGCHESGHGLGLEHLPDGNLLAPYYDRGIFKPQKGDIDEAQMRYGPPVPVTSSPPPIPAPSGGQIPVDMWLGGVRYIGQVKAMQS